MNSLLGSIACKPAGRQPSRRGVVLPALFAVLLAFSAPATNAQVDWDGLDLPRVAYSGRVQGHDGAPLAGARVWLVPNGRVRAAAGLAVGSWAGVTGLGGVDPEEDVVLRVADLPGALTDAEGRWLLRAPFLPMKVPRGFWSLGRTRAVLVVSAPGHGVHTLLLDDPVSERLEVASVRLPKGGTLVGTVRGEDGRGLAGARVQLLKAPGREGKALWAYGNRQPLLPGLDLFQAVADQAGRYRLEGLPLGELALQAEAPGHLLREFEGGLQLSREHERDLTLERGPSVVGVVLDEAGHPLEDAQVLVTTHLRRHAGRGCMIRPITETDDGDLLEFVEVDDRARWTTRARTGPDGRFDVSSLPGLADLTVFVAAPGRELALVADVSGGDDLRVVLPTAAVLELSLVDPDGAPVGDAWVRAERVTGLDDDPPLPVQALDGAGRFRVVGAGPLGTRVTVLAPGRAVARVELPGQPTASRREHTLSLGPAGAISGLLRFDDGRLAPGVAITLDCADLTRPDLDLRTVTDAEGRYRFDGLPEGDYRVYPSWRRDLRHDGPRTVVVLPGQTREIDLVVIETGELVVHVIRPSGHSVARAPVYVLKRGTWREGLADAERREGQVSWNPTDAEGLTSFRLLPGLYELLVGDGPPSLVEIEVGEELELYLSVAEVRPPPRPRESH